MALNVCGGVTINSSVLQPVDLDPGGVSKPYLGWRLWQPLDSIQEWDGCIKTEFLINTASSRCFALQFLRPALFRMLPHRVVVKI